MGAILCFHSLTTPELPAEGDAHVPWTFFERTVRLARRFGEVVPLSTLVERHRAGRSTAGLTALTFDDAYAALSGQLAALVRTERVPVTIFVTTGASRSSATFWWDRVDDAFARVDRARWRAFEDACGLPDEYRTRQPAEYGPLRPLRQWILSQYAGRWPAKLEPALAALEEDAGATTRHRAMSVDELTALSKIPGVDFGVHTVSHPVLPLLADDDLAQEIDRCHRTLRDAFPCVQPFIAVPFALYDRRTIDVARSAGMVATLSLSGQTLSRGHDGDALPRVCVTRQDTLARLAFRITGCRDAIDRLRGRQVPDYPALPSAAT